MSSSPSASPSASESASASASTSPSSSESASASASTSPSSSESASVSPSISASASLSESPSISASPSASFSASASLSESPSISASPSLGEWVYSVIKAGASPSGSAVLKFSFTCYGTALSVDLFEIIDDEANATTLRAIFAGKKLVKVTTNPAAAPDAPTAAYTLTITDISGDVATFSNRHVSNTESVDVIDATVSGRYLNTFHSLLLTCTDAPGIANKFDLYLEVE